MRGHFLCLDEVDKDLVVMIMIWKEDAEQVFML